MKSSDENKKLGSNQNLIYKKKKKKKTQHSIAEQNRIGFPKLVKERMAYSVFSRNSEFCWNPNPKKNGYIYI